MSSFNKADYRRIYEIGLMFYNYHESTKYEKEALELMDMAEDVIGQQSDRPDYTRDPGTPYPPAL